MRARVSSSSVAMRGRVRVAGRKRSAGVRSITPADGWAQERTEPPALTRGLIGSTGASAARDDALGAAHALDRQAARHARRLGHAREEPRGVVGADRDARLGGEERAVPALAEDGLDDLALDGDGAPRGAPGVGAELDAVLAPGDLLGPHGERVGEAEAIAEDELGEEPVAGRLGEDDAEERATVLRRQGQVVHAEAFAARARDPAKRV